MRAVLGWLVTILGTLLAGVCVLWAGLGFLVGWLSPGRYNTAWQPLVVTWLTGFLGGMAVAAILILTGALLRRASTPASAGEVGGTSKAASISLPLLTLFPVLALAGLVSYFGYCELAFDPGAPPPLLITEELGQQKLLFDGKTTDGWRIDGPAAVHDGTLEIGGAQAATAHLLHEFEPGDKTRFQFFHEGPGKHPQEVILRITPLFVNPNDPHKGTWQQQPEAHLGWRGLTPDGGVHCWHEGAIQASYQGNHFDLTINLNQRVGQEGGPVYTYGRSTEGCRYLVVVQTSAGNKVLLRNVRVAKAPAAKAGS
jgi:hypothetical protein